MKKMITLLLITIFYLLQINIVNAIDLSVGKGRISAKPIAIVPFANNIGENKIDFIVSFDLKQSGIFVPISPQMYQERTIDAQKIDFSTFQKLGAAYVVTGEIVNNQMINVSIADSFQQKTISKFKVDIINKTIRQASHEISDIILKKLTGVRGSFATHLAYVYESGQGYSRRYNIVISDSDGKNPISLLSSLAPVMSPRFSPNGRLLAYVTFEGNQSQIVTHDIKSGKRKLVSKELGINATPSWSPDGKKIAMVLSKDGNSEIYFKNISNGRLIRVTNNPNIDTEPVWSPDGSHIYFTSDRSGKPQLYRINLNDGMVTQITKNGIYSAGADVSSDGKKIALARNIGGKFVIGTIDLKNGKFTVISKGFTDESPRFSPNDKMIIFTSVQNSQEVLKIVNVDGSFTNTISPVSGRIRDPDWSNYIK